MIIVTLYNVINKKFLYKGAIQYLKSYPWIYEHNFYDYFTFSGFHLVVTIIIKNIRQKLIIKYLKQNVHISVMS